MKTNYTEYLIIRMLDISTGSLSKKKKSDSFTLFFFVFFVYSNKKAECQFLLQNVGISTVYLRLQASSAT